MNKGFTLVELLGVITILGIVSLITVPMVQQSIVKSQNEVLEQNKKEAVSSAERYVVDNADDLLCDGGSCTEYVKNGNTFCLSLSYLENEGYLKKGIKDPSTNGALGGYVKVSYNNKLVYEYSTSSCDINF